MTERAAHLMDAVLPPVPYRQWVLSLPHALRYLLAFDHVLACRVLAIFVRAIGGLQRRRAGKRGIQKSQLGGITVMQRFASGLRLNVHFHTLLTDGVFYEDGQGKLAFCALPPPTKRELAKLVATVRRRVLRLLVRRGQLDDDHAFQSHGLKTGSAALAHLAAASVRNVCALGSRAGAPVMRLGRERDADWVRSRKDFHAHALGFDLHAGVSIAARARKKLERLCRYLLRPAVAQERLRFIERGQVAVKLKARWSDGTSYLVLEPAELLARLASLVPRPRTNLLIYHGVLAGNAKWRKRVVTYGASGEGKGRVFARRIGASPGSETQSSKLRNYSWAELMQRAFGIDVLECPGCGGRLRLIATIVSPAAVRRILEHLGLPSRLPTLSPARAPPEHAA